jgi:hypothetical protein
VFRPRDNAWRCASAAAYDVTHGSGDPLRDYVVRDISLALGCLAPGGTLALHDYGVEGAHDHLGNWHDFGVAEAVHEFCEQTGASMRQVDTLAIITPVDCSSLVATAPLWA